MSNALPIPKDGKKLRDKERIPRLERYIKSGG